MYDDIADAMSQKRNWSYNSLGSAWNIDNIADWDRPMEDARNNYIDVRRSQGRRPFIDGPHFELLELMALTEKQQKFLDVLEEARGNSVEAKKLAGYSENVATLHYKCIKRTDS